MSVDPVRSYLDARKKLDEVTSQVQALMDQLNKATSILTRNWRGVTLLNQPMPIPTVRTLPSSSAEAVDLQSWPDAKRIAQVIGEWRAARINADTLWDAVPQNDRKNLRAPSAF